MKICILFDPHDCAAEELCLYMKCEAEKMSRKISLINIDEMSQSFLDCDAIIVSASFSDAGYSVAATEYLKDHHELLNSIPTFFVSIFDHPKNDPSILSSKQEAAKALLTALDLAPQKILCAVLTGSANDNILTDWITLKLALQNFLVRNDVMMAG